MFRIKALSRLCESNCTVCEVPVYFCLQNELEHMYKSELKSLFAYEMVEEMGIKHSLFSGKIIL